VKGWRGLRQHKGSHGTSRLSEFYITQLSGTSKTDSCRVGTAPPACNRSGGSRTRLGGTRPPRQTATSHLCAVVSAKGDFATIGELAHNFTVTTSDSDPPLTLADAEDKFRGFLSVQNYPTTVCWLMEGDLLIDKARHFWVRERRLEAERHAALRYSEELERNLGVHLHAICSTNEQTFASVFVPADELDAQYHLMGRRLKVSCPTERYSTSTVKNPIHWLALWLRYGRQVKKSQSLLFE
jgi:hypothetical protein